MRLFTHAAVAALAVSAVACRVRDRDQAATSVDSTATAVGQDVREGADKARDEAREATRSLKSYGWNEREELRADMRRRLADIDGQIEQLSADARSSGSTIGDAAMKDIRTARTAVDRDLGRLDGATENGWNDVRGSIDHSLEHLRDRIAEVTRTGGPMGGRSPGQN